MTVPSSEQPLAMPGRSQREDSLGASSRERLGVFSFRPLVEKDVGAVDAEDIQPSSGPHETDVWLTEWQVAEDGFDVALDQHVDWHLVSMDADWATQLFAGHRTISLQLDTYAEARRHPTEALVWTHLTGRVTRIDQISVRFHPSEDPAERGVRVAETGGAMQHSVLSLQSPRVHHGVLVGWIVRVRK
ncbi:DUF6578 domain-containing protein [Cryobacterium sp. TMT4-31]|uniref:DUF6578 domain-containing protein n=1 Tax=Cryobacterium sp. TMT4-31 TaxID=1259259 RepID=UPI00106B9B19|nr:DUF6578 domain-containing protein [Cryobacterium sp. TMT4-31]TFC87764.1 hypothetical protein E3T19_11575 [Cryobacterium sp. TMT4-31]